VKIEVLWVVKPCRLVNGHRCFGESYCLSGCSTMNMGALLVKIVCDASTENWTGSRMELQMYKVRCTSSVDGITLSLRRLLHVSAGNACTYVILQ
jgi:hypothetical protein